jgi:hypothetical protein
MSGGRVGNGFIYYTIYIDLHFRRLLRLQRSSSMISAQANILPQMQDERTGFVAQETLDGTINLFQCRSGLDHSKLAAKRVNRCRCFEKHFDRNDISKEFVPRSPVREANVGDS